MNAQAVEEFIRYIDRKLPRKSLLTTKEVAMCNTLFNENTLGTWRLSGHGPEFIKISDRKVRYFRDSVLRWARGLFGKEHKEKIEEAPRVVVEDLPKIKTEPTEPVSILRVEARIGENTLKWLDELIVKMSPNGYGRVFVLPKIIRSLVLFLKKSGIDISTCKREEEIVSLLCSKLKVS